MTSIEVEDGVEVFVRDMGMGDPIVFLHGWPLDHRMFEYQYQYLLDEGFRCIGIDLRGFGESDKPYGDYSYDRFADDVRAVLDELDVEGVTLAGFSMGGATATHYMSRHDEAYVDKLALLGAASPVITEKPDFPEGLDEAEVNPLIEGARTDRAKMNADFDEMLFYTDQSEEMMNWIWSLGMKASGQATVASAKTWRDADLRPDMNDITVPTKVYHGVHDEVTPIETTGEILTEGIQNAELVRFENSGHGLVADETEKINEELATFAN
ncbi:Pimeloyl-ACP methyl ester carboxylesterase [Natronorubrum sediminis]|uniref:Pimeloyl-ACP methyl ester carboxylesterase n=1 Tax=Natronorubrum sediminis TaxID=640943 RepID=A0A1H6FY57_9EURY|nr:alpha/beta hydrolase [Natronorubrum sediminis]SEH15726.1 Pimeloyl-ACP methyl ester carboxylesterase [Natronorubrum sediminis]